ncbi:MAG: amino acid adenylation domain-containing protein, partial [Pyrinomonadaceae bacterium]
MQHQEIEGFRLSPQQRRVWRLQQSSAGLHAQCAVLIEGPLRREHLDEALRQVVVRHEILRTSFHRLPGLDLPLQVVNEEAPARLREVSLAAANDAELRLAEQMREERERAFDYERGEMLRLLLAEMGADRHVLVLSLPALCADTWALKHLLEDVVRHYEAAASGAQVEDELVQYVDFSEWQHELLESEEKRAGREFWQSQQQETAELPQLSLPLEGQAADEYRPETINVEVGGVGRQLDLFVCGQETTAETVLLACWQIFLGRLTGAREFVVNTAFDGGKYAELQGSVGLFTKHLPLRFTFDERQTLADAVRQVGQAHKEAYRWQEYFDREEGMAGQEENSLIGFAYEELPESFRAAQVTFTPSHFSACSERFKLSLTVSRAATGLRLTFTYDSSLFTSEVVRRWSEGYEALLSAALSAPDSPSHTLPALAAAERGLLLDSWGVHPQPLSRSTQSLLDQFRHFAALRGEEPALVCEGDTLSFSRLDLDSDRLAHLLRARGVRPGTVVALVMPRGVAAVLAAVAVWKSGAAYLPLDPEQPARRLAFMAEDSRASLVLATAETEQAARSCSAPVLLVAEALAETTAAEAAPLADDSAPSDLAYVIYTSGSTGEPKGVMVERASLLSLHASLRREVYAAVEAAAGVRPLRISLNAPMYFDASVKQLVQLLSGHTLVVIPEALRRDPAALVDYLRAHQVDVLDTTPSLLRLLLDEGLAAGEVRPLAVLSGGEAIDAELWRRLADEGGVRFHNLYGPTECTVDATSRLVGAGERADEAEVDSGAAGERPSIGRPLANTRVYVLDARGRLAPAGAAGELYIGGAGVARGYLNRPALTAGRFIPDPFSSEPGARLYRTGDVVRYLPSGELEYVGRADRQVKLRGYRVELGEVEAALRRRPGVRDAAATLRGEGGRERLVAYVAGQVAADPFGGVATHRLPDGRRVAHRNRNETDYLFEELFTKRSYFRHGVGLTDGAVVFDVGANIGMFSVLALDECPTARVYAFEPLTEVAECLRANARVYGRGRVRVFGHGLSDAEREEEFSYYPRYTMMSGERRYADAEGEVSVITRYLENERAGGSEEAGELLANSRALLEGRFEERRERCRLRRLSEVMREEGVAWVDLLKVDVQRAESDVLRGLDAWAWARVGQVVMEVHDEAAGGGGRVRELKEELGGLGFLVEAEQDELLEGTDRWNLYAVRSDYAEARSAALAGEAARGAEAQGVESGEVVGLEVGAVRAGLERELPEYMRPAAYVVLDSLPLTRNGKVDYRALPDPAEAEGEGGEEARPATPVEELLCGVWAGLLKVGRVRPTDNFFELGGHSLLATQLVSRVREACGVELPLRALFESPTVEGMAAQVEARLRGEEGSVPPPVVRVERGESAPLSFAQQRLWFIDRLEGGSAFYNSPAAVRLSG